MKKMRTIYSLKVFGIIALLSISGVLAAQEDQTLNRELTLEREYDPSVQDANKVNTLPAVKEPEVKKMPIDYAVFTVPAEPQREIGLLPAGSIMTDIQYNKRRGYLNVGAGTHLNINADLGYHILSTDKDQLNIFFSHRSTKGNVKYIQDHIDAKAKARLNDNIGGLNYRHVFDKAAFKIGGKYGYSSFNYYGLSPELFPVTTPPSSLPGENGETFVFLKDTNQVNQTIQAYIGVESLPDAPVGYLLNVDYTNFSQKYLYTMQADGVQEHLVNGLFDLNASFGGSQRVGLGAKVTYLTNTLPSVQIDDMMFDFSTNRFIGSLSPYYKAEGDNWNLKLGLNASFISKEDKKFVISPNISADVNVGSKTVLYLNAGGGPELNNHSAISLRNRYALISDLPVTSRTWLDAMAGVKSGVGGSFWFDIFAGYKVTDDDCFFVPNTYIANDFGNINNAFSWDSKRFLFGANLKYAYQKLFEITLKGVYNNWSLDDSELDGTSVELKAYGRPELEITGGIQINPIDKLSFQVDYYLATGRYTTFKDLEAFEMKNINELNITGSYRINDTFGVYAKLNNVLFQKYDLYYGYPAQRFSIMGGVNINF